MIVVLPRHTHFNTLSEYIGEAECSDINVAPITGLDKQKIPA